MSMKSVMVAVLSLVSASSLFADESSAKAADWSPVGIGIGVPDLSARPNLRNNRWIWPDSSANIYGLDLTALCGLHHDVRGLQCALLISSSDSLKGLGVSCVDYIYEDFGGLMIGGYAALAKQRGDGAMIAGGFTYVNDFRGFQLAGGVNWAESGSTFQIGCFNYAGTAKCLQIGLLNFGKEGLRCCPIVRAHW